jgi:hypothetical protein
MLLRQLLAALSSTQSQWAATGFTGTYADAKSNSAAFQEYKSSTKREWVTERQDLVTLFGNIQTKLKTYGLREWKPQSGLDVAVGSAVVHYGGTFVKLRTHCLTYLSGP